MNVALALLVVVAIAVTLTIDYALMLGLNFILQPWHVHVGYGQVVVGMLILGAIASPFRSRA